MKVVFLTKYGKLGASSRYRFYNYKNYFEGFEYEFVPLLDDRYIKILYKNESRIKLFLYQFISIFKRFFYLLTSSRDNFYIIEKELFPNVPYFLEKFLLRKRNYALDYDDYVGASYKTNKIKKIFLKDKLNDLVSKARFVTVGNKWYFEEFRSSNLIYLPTVIDIGLYESVYKEKDSSVVLSNDTFKIVWIGSPSTLRYLKLIEKPLKKLSANFKIKLIIIGGECPFEFDNVEIIKWEEESEIFNLAKGDVGIMPLFDTLWEKGKCGFKLIQYMGVGLPVLASESPANSEIVVNCGYICNSEEEWFEKLLFLLSNPEMRINFGRNSFERAKSNYSYQVWGVFYNALISRNLNKK